MTEYKLSNVKKDRYDSRDYIYKPDMTTPLPSSVDLRQYAGGIENQLHTGSCVANATVSALELLLEKASDFIDLSRMFLYYNIRAPYDHLNEVDEGAYLRDAFKSVNESGICTETTWPFVESQVNVLPNNVSYQEALSRKVGKYERVVSWGQGDLNNANIMKLALAKGHPITISVSLGQTFYGITGPLDTHNYPGVQGDLIGGHAMNVVGYDDAIGSFIVENSWGPSWGSNGYCAISYQVMVNDLWDCWVCTEFAGHVFEDEFISDVDPLVVGDLQTSIHKYNGNRVSNVYMLAEASGGTAPYTYKFRYPMGEVYQESDDSFCHIQQLIPDTQSSNYIFPILCYITDSSIPTQTEWQEFRINYLNQSYNIIKDIEGIIKLYIAYFNVVPDKAGLEYWAGCSLTLSQIGETFASIAFNDVYSPGLSNDDFVRILYTNIFNRNDIDQASIDWWSSVVSLYSYGYVTIAMINCAVGDESIFLDNKVEVCKKYTNVNLLYDLTLITEDTATVGVALKLL